MHGNYQRCLEIAATGRVLLICIAVSANQIFQQEPMIVTTQPRRENMFIRKWARHPAINTGRAAHFDTSSSTTWSATPRILIRPK
jgi:hypothetical protein